MDTIPISILELQAKIAYMKDKHIPFVQSDGTLHPIFTMNSKELASATGMNLIGLEHQYVKNPRKVIDEMLSQEIDSFQTRYEQASAYYEEHGNSNITKISKESITRTINYRKNDLKH